MIETKYSSILEAANISLEALANFGISLKDAVYCDAGSFQLLCPLLMSLICKFAYGIEQDITACKQVKILNSCSSH